MGSLGKSPLSMFIRCPVSLLCFFLALHKLNRFSFLPGRLRFSFSNHLNSGFGLWAPGTPGFPFLPPSFSAGGFFLFSCFLVLFPLSWA